MSVLYRVLVRTVDEAEIKVEAEIAVVDEAEAKATKAEIEQALKEAGYTWDHRSSLWRRQKDQVEVEIAAIGSEWGPED